MIGVIGKLEEWLQGKKTYILMIGGVVAGIVAYVNGELTLTQTIAAIWTALTAGAIRSGVAKSGPTE